MSQKTTITLLLDSSGSMKKNMERTVSALNEYVDGMRDEEGIDARFSLVTFHADGYKPVLNVVFSNKSCSEMMSLSPKDITCKGGTPLLHAVVETINAMEASLGERRDIRPILMIQTDGEENSSQNVTVQQVRDLIERKRTAGWEFVFMGCGIDAYADGQNLGFDKERVISYRNDDVSTLNAFAATASATTRYLRGASFGYTADEKTMSGDEHAARAEPSFGDAVRDLMKDKNVSMTDVTKRMGISRSHMYNVLRGDRTATPEFVDDVSKALSADTSQRRDLGIAAAMSAGYVKNTNDR